MKQAQEEFSSRARESPRLNASRAAGASQARCLLCSSETIRRRGVGSAPSGCGAGKYGRKGAVIASCVLLIPGFGRFCLIWSRDCCAGLGTARQPQGRPCVKVSRSGAVRGAAGQTAESMSDGREEGSTE